MGILSISLGKLRTTEIEAHILLLGLSGTGKTILLYQLKLNETVTTQCQVYDVGIHEKSSTLWRHYYPNTDGVSLWLTVWTMNAFNLSGAQPPIGVAEKMGLKEKLGKTWHVQGCCAVSRKGIPEAMEKLSEMVRWSGFYQKTWG
uniref:Uncharacterized protein n=1 Tax=Anolis carolinensis TaxID=28377 RepID=A0A803STC4_ANOCA